MPLYLDVHHKVPDGTTVKDVAEAHRADLRVQDKYGVRFLRYWVDEGEGKVFCLADSPSPESMTNVHKEAHGLIADEIYAVQEGS